MYFRLTKWDLLRKAFYEKCTRYYRILLVIFMYTGQRGRPEVGQQTQGRARVSGFRRPQKARAWTGTQRRRQQATTVSLLSRDCVSLLSRNEFFLKM